MTTSSYGLRGTEHWPIGGLESDNELLERMRFTYNETAVVNQTFWNTASIDERFYAGDQSLWNEVYSHIPAFRRKQFNFNKIKRIVNMVSGYQRRNRKSLIVQPIEGSDELTADQFSRLLIWLNNKESVLNTISDAFLGALVCGINLLSIWVDNRQDPLSGDIKVDNLGYNGFIIDPYFSKIDLSDCNFLWIRRFLSKRQIASIFPDRAEEVQMMRADSHKDGRFNFLPQNYTMAYRDLLAFDEYWYLDYRDATVIVDKETGETLEYNGKKDNLKYFLKLNPDLRADKIIKPAHKLGIVVNGTRVFYHGRNPYKIDRLPYVPVVGFHQPELPYYEWRLQGMVRGMRDSQFLMNRRQQILLDVLESQVNSGLKVMEGSLIDDMDAFKTGQGQALFIKKDAPLGMASVEKIPPADVSAAFVQVIDQMDKNLLDISGVNEELLGSADDDKAGVLSMLRQGAGLTTLEIFFDKLDLSMKNLGEIEMELIQANYQPGKIERILNEKPSEQFYKKAFQKYDCQVTEGINTPTQRMMAFKQALALKEMGLPISTKFVLEMSSFQNKQELIKDVMQQEQQQAQMAQQQAQLQMMELQAKAELATSRAQADKGLAAERVSRVNENESLAIERRAQAVLDEVKAMQELQGLDINQIKGMLEILDKIKGFQDVKTEEKNPVKTTNQSSVESTLQSTIEE